MAAQSMLTCAIRARNNAVTTAHHPLALLPQLRPSQAATAAAARRVQLRRSLGSRGSKEVVRTKAERGRGSGDGRSASGGPEKGGAQAGGGPPPGLGRWALQGAYFLLFLMLLDAAYSGDWSRIGAISKQTEQQLQAVCVRRRPGTPARAAQCGPALCR